MSTPGTFVNEQLKTSVPWNDLVSQSNLQTLIHAIVQRLDRNDKAIAQAVSKSVLSRKVHTWLTV